MTTLKTSFALVAALIAMNLPSARAEQPEMKAALMHLREARAALAKAEHNKAGHRDKAVQLVEQAIAEVEAGMDAAR
jgi:hypothetical protein